MSLFDFFKIKKFKTTISRLEYDNAELIKQINGIQQQLIDQQKLVKTLQFFIHEQLPLFDTDSLSHSNLSGSTSDLWVRYWGNCNHEDYFSVLRKKRASLGYMTPLYIDTKNGAARFHGSNCDYRTTIISCECTDFHKRLMPCKHMYRLAHELGVFLINNEVVTVPDPSKILNNNDLHKIKSLLSNKSTEILERIISKPSMIINACDASQLIHLNVAVVDPNKFELLNSLTKQQLLDLLPSEYSGSKSLKKTLLIEKIIADYPCVISKIERKIIPIKLSPYASRLYEQYNYL